MTWTNWPPKAADAFPVIVSDTYRTVDVSSLERRIAELEAENGALKHDLERVYQVVVSEENA